MKIIKIGGFDERGMPTAWHFDMEANKPKKKNPSQVWGVGGLELSLDKEATVSVGGVEIVQWSEARRKALEGDTS